MMTVLQNLRRAEILTASKIINTKCLSFSLMFQKPKQPKIQVLEHTALLHHKKCVKQYKCHMETTKIPKELLSGRARESQEYCGLYLFAQKPAEPEILFQKGQVHSQHGKILTRGKLCIKKMQ